MVSFKTKAGISSKVLSTTTKQWVSGGGKAGGSSFSTQQAKPSSFSSGPKPTSSFSSKPFPPKPFSKDLPQPIRTIVFKTVTKPTSVSKPGIFSPVNWGKPTPYVAPKPKPKQGTWVAPKTSGGGSSDGSSGPKIGTHHPDSANRAMTAPGGGKLRSKNIGTGSRVTY